MVKSEIARMGANALKARVVDNPNYFSELGKRGGIERSKQLGPKGYSELGKKGGRGKLSKYGMAVFKDMAKKGGEAMATHGSDYFSEIGKKGRKKQLLQNKK